MAGKRRGRPSASAERNTREAILTSTRELLSKHGFERTTIRAVAAGAEVDAALVHHYFGTKMTLVGEALAPPVDFAAVFEDMPTDATAGPEFVRRALRLWESPQVRAHVVGVLRLVSSSADVAALVRDIPGTIVQAALGSAVRDDHRDRRLALIASHMLGLLMLRFVIGDPDMVAADSDGLATQIGPVIAHYLQGELE